MEIQITWTLADIKQTFCNKSNEECEEIFSRIATTLEERSIEFGYELIKELGDI